MESIPESALLATLLAASVDGIVAYDRAGIIVVSNAAAARLFNCSAAALCGCPLSRILPEERPLLESPDSDRPARWVATRGLDFAGGPLALLTTHAPIRGGAGEVVGGVLVIRHAAGTHGARAAAPSSATRDAERLNLALAASGLGDWSWDAQTDRVVLSARAAEIFGIPGDAPVTWTTLRELLHPDDREIARQAVERAAAERVDYALDYRVIHGESERWVSARGRGRYGERGEVLGMLGVVQEISGDRLLLRVDDAVRSLIKPEDITYTAARVLGEHLRVNRCAYASVEDDQDTFVLTGNYTEGVHSIVGRYRFRQFGAECLRLMRAGEPYVVEDSAVDPRIDDFDRTAYEQTEIRSVVCVPILKAGRFVGAMAVHAKSTRSWSPAEVQLVQQVASRCWESIERARVEQEREGLLEAAEAANRVKDEFMAMLGHELRNPLAPMFTALHLMKSRGDASFARERAVIERQVTHLARLVDDLLDVSRITRGKVELRHELVELSEIVTRAVDVASPLLEQRAHTLTCDIPSRGLLVQGDVTRLVQVVSNLLTNAAKYTPPSGRISLFTSGSESELALHVQDSGIGMSPEVLQHAFDLFVQGRQSIDRAHGGLGLGLTIVRSLVERHGGSVRAHSGGPDQGSEFVVRLPRAEPGALAAQRSGAPPPALSPSARGARVLVVDDSEDGAQMLADVLTSYGCEVQIAHDGLQALRLGAAHVFDAALLDIGLPVMDGYELAGRLRELPNLREARLIAVTGYGQEADRKQALAAGFEEHLVKPLDVHTLEKVVAKLSSQSH